MKFLIEDVLNEKKDSKQFGTSAYDKNHVSVAEVSKFAVYDPTAQPPHGQIADVLDQRLEVFTKAYNKAMRKINSTPSGKNLDPEFKDRLVRGKILYNLSTELQGINLQSAPGIGKSQVMKQWAKSHLGPGNKPINVVQFKCTGLKPGQFSGPDVVTDNEIMIKDEITGETTPYPKPALERIENDLFRQLNQPNSILFLDEFNRASRVQGEFVEFISSHTTPGLGRALPNLLFIVICTNPKTSDDEIEFSPAMNRRFETVEIISNKQEWGAYQLPILKNECDDALEDYVQAKATNSNDIEKCKDELFEWLSRVVICKQLTSPSSDFVFDDARKGSQGVKTQGICNPASLTSAILKCTSIKQFINESFERSCIPAVARQSSKGKQEANALREDVHQALNKFVPYTFEELLGEVYDFADEDKLQDNISKSRAQDKEDWVNNLITSYNQDVAPDWAYWDREDRIMRAKHGIADPVEKTPEEVDEIEEVEDTEGDEE